MSNIPFNTIASILGTQNLSREIAAPKDKEFNDLIASRKASAAKARSHAEQVEDAAEYGVDNVHDQQNNAPGEDQQEMPRRQPEERVEIAGIAPERSTPKLGDVGPASHLDISA